MKDLKTTIDTRIAKMRNLLAQKYIVAAAEAAILGQSVIFDTIGSAHPLMHQLKGALDANDYTRLNATSQGVISLYEEGMLYSPRLTIAKEIEDDILDIAQAQIEAAERSTDESQKAMQLGIAAFLAGAAIEDALRRLCDAHSIEYDHQKTSISSLQAKLYQPSASIELITRSEQKHITAWGDTRNKADHGHFSTLTHTEVLTMVIGIRGFIEVHLTA